MAPGKKRRLCDVNSIPVNKMRVSKRLRSVMSLAEDMQCADDHAVLDGETVRKVSRGKRQHKGDQGPSGVGGNKRLKSVLPPHRVSNVVSANSSTSRYFRRLGNVPTSAWELSMDDNCEYCDAVRFVGEVPGFCCQSGAVRIDLPRMHPRLWDLFVNDRSPIGNEFRRRCRSYNNTLAFSSMYCEQDWKLANNKKGAYIVKLQGIISHYVTHLIPKNALPRHAQLYFYGTEKEIENRVAQAKDLDQSIIETLLDILKVNPYHNFFMQARELECDGSFSIILRGDPELDKNVYNMPVVDHVAAIWHENGDDVPKKPKDIRVYNKRGGSVQIKYYYGCYDPLRYVLLHPYGEPGWRPGLEKLESAKSVEVTDEPEDVPMEPCLNDPAIASSSEQLLRAEKRNAHRKKRSRRNISLREYYAYMYQIRRKCKMCILRVGRLAQQHQIDMYIKVETQRLEYLRKKQRERRAAQRGGTFNEVSNMAKDRKGLKGFAVGRRIKLCTTITGSPRDLRRRFMNALAIVSEHGSPDLFVTMTCNRKWIEIQRELLGTEEAYNRGDLLARVFKAKNDELKKELIDKELFGKVAAYFYVIEFQKRGLPHVHWLIILKPQFKINAVAAYDKFVCAELPDPNVNRHLYDCVVRHMMHGPCGELNKENVCMVGGVCKNDYPKSYRAETEHRDDAYPAYRRRDDGRSVRVRRHKLDNRWVVPYNPYLLAKFDCHINVEICADIRSVKYLYKYVCKGNDQVAYNIIDDESTDVIDEIENYRTARWICAPEAMCRLYKFDLFGMYPTVYQLHVHLPGYHWVSYGDDADIDEIVTDAEDGKTQLTEFFKMNTKPEVAAMNLLYQDFPKFFVWNKTTRIWTKRKRRTVVGRLVSVHINDVERFYLRLLLNHVRAPTSYENLRTYRNVMYDTFREAAMHRGLLESDADLRKAMEEASGYQMPYSLRRFFCMILINNCPADPAALWNEFKDDLSSDFIAQCTDTKDAAHFRALEAIDIILNSMGQGVDKYKLVPYDVAVYGAGVSHREYQNEINIKVSPQDLNSVTLLNDKQRAFYEEIMKSVSTRKGRAFFVDGPGGTGKTFLYKALLASVRSKGRIALAVASSGVAASLLPNGRTAHSRFKLPLKLDESLLCGISKGTGEAKLIIEADLIVWDEASMANRKHIEALDLLLQDLMENNLMFGGKTVVFGGDFRQTIPIVPRGSREDCIDACFVNSFLWSEIQKMQLTENMRAKQDPEFVDFLMQVGNGLEPEVHGDYIELQSELCLPYLDDNAPLENLVNEIFPSFDLYKDEPTSAINHAILTPKNDEMEAINMTMIEKFPGVAREYISTNTANDPKQQEFYQDFLNGIDVGSLPPHILKLKPNCPIMLLRNIDPGHGLCNGTRLIVRQTGERVLVATIASGAMTGTNVMIPRITLEYDDLRSCPVPFKRYQFPVRLCFAMSINKAQGQTLDVVGVYLPCSVFSHGQLYVALSRVRTSTAIKVLIRPPMAGMESTYETRNVVYHEVLHAARVMNED